MTPFSAIDNIITFILYVVAFLSNAVQINFEKEKIPIGMSNVKEVTGFQ